MGQDTTSTGPEGYHTPVLVHEVSELIAPVLPGVVVDATFGGGGHSRHLLDEFGGEVTIIAVDRDPEAGKQASRIGLELIVGNFADLDTLVDSAEPVRAVLFDFGVSSHQVNTPERGFSYHHAGPLDMRMGPDAELTAAEIVNEWDEERLVRAIRSHGEDPAARRIAAAIVAARPIADTKQLAAVVASAVPASRRMAGHPARRTFQAIRIAVNAELDGVTAGLEAGIQMLAPGGRIVAISYHSLEDRIVKQRFAAGATGCICPPDLPVCGCGRTSELRILTRRPIRPTPEEIAANKRSRSAKLRAAEKVAA